MYCAIGINNKFRLLFLYMYLVFSDKKVYFYNTLFFKKESIPDKLVKSGKISFENKGIGEIKGLFYKVNEKALEFTNLFFEKKIANSPFLKDMEKALQTKKYSAYLKKKMVFDFYEVLAALYLIKESAAERKAILIDSEENRFIVSNFLRDNAISVEICWLPFSALFSIEPLIYYAFLIKKLFNNGITTKKKARVRLYREAAWGLSKPVMRDDFLIDNVQFKKDDIVFYSRTYSVDRNRAAEQIKRAGYAVIDINKCPLNIRAGLLFLGIFVFQPFAIFSKLILQRKPYLLEYTLKFYIESFPHFLFLTNYNTKIHVSVSDSGEVAETIIMNMFGCNNILYHWGDMTAYKGVTSAFAAHNIFYTWGPIHHDFQKENRFCDRVEAVGCIFLKSYYDCAGKLEVSGKDASHRRILMCDNSLNNTVHFSEDFYLNFLDLSIKILDEIDDAMVLFKAKADKEDILGSFTNTKKRLAYIEKMDYLTGHARFLFYDGTVTQVEPLIASADIVITMGMASTSTIALSLRKEAIYYDYSGNTQHPMTQYMNKVVFEDKKLLVEQINNILKKDVSVFQYIHPSLLTQYEPYNDSHALERLIESVHKRS